ncbi:MAG TPA: hypothetical protein VGA66_10345 [Mycobacterium sp.]
MRLRLRRRPPAPAAPVPDLLAASFVFFLSDVSGTVDHLRNELHNGTGPAAASLHHARGELDRLAARITRFEQAINNEGVES